eukprot:2540020-Prymnesium_polylepis.2
MVESCGLTVRLAVGGKDAAEKGGRKVGRPRVGFHVGRAREVQPARRGLLGRRWLLEGCWWRALGRRRAQREDGQHVDVPRMASGTKSCRRWHSTE